MIRRSACPRFGQYAKRGAAPRVIPIGGTSRIALGFESLARRFESCGLPGEILPARHGNIDIGRMQSTAWHARPVISAAMIVVPEPTKGS